MAAKITRKIGPLSLRAQLGSVDAKARTAEVVWTTGAAVQRFSWDDGAYMEELSLDPAHVRMGRLNSGAPLLADHSGRLSAVLGVVESARLEGDKGTAVVRFAAAGIDPEADKIFEKVRDQVIKNISVGYRVHKLEKSVVRTGEIPTMRATDWEPFELSVVAIGADAAAGFRSEGFRSEHAEKNDVEISTQERSKMDPEELKKIQEAEAQKRLAEQSELVARAVTEERERVEGIRHAVKAGGLAETEATRMIGDKTPLAAAREFVINALAKRDQETPTIQNISITGGEDDRSKKVRGLVAGIVGRHGGEEIRAAAKKGLHLRAEEVDFNSPHKVNRLSDVARAFLAIHGVRTGAMGNEELLKTAFAFRGFQGTSDFSIALENAMNKVLLGAYAYQDLTWSKVCKAITVPDFRPQPFYRLGAIANGMLKVNENSEFQNFAIPDASKVLISTETKGGILSVSRQLLVGDDMGAITDLAGQAGRMAALAIELEFYALLALNSGLGPTVGANPFFHATNANVGSSSAINATGALAADRVLMRKQKDPQGREYLDLRPDVLLIPVELRDLAEQVIGAEYDTTVSNKNMVPNTVKNFVRQIVDSPRVSDISTTRRYLFSDPQQTAPAFVCAYLAESGTTPVIQTQDGWRVDGFELKIRHDFKVQAFDPKAAVTNAGT